jgi:hypothetical protein
MAKSGAARSGPSFRVRGLVLANPERIMRNEMNRIAMPTQEPLPLTTLRVRVVTAMLGISRAVAVDGKGG